MSKTVWEFRLGANCVIEMPEGAEILSVHGLDEAVCVWALVDPYAKKINRHFVTYYTGSEIEPENLKFIGTAVLVRPHGELAFHVFEIVEKPSPFFDAGYDE